MIKKGAVSTGHPKTTEAGKIILEDGGNAFDAILASFFMSCVCEPAFASLGGGGFLTAHNAKKDESVVYDFFAQTPKKKEVKDLDFYATLVDFGGATQEFHIGKGSMAMPGGIHGVIKIHEELCSLPMEKIIEPAVQAARVGVKVNWMTELAFELLEGIFLASEESFKIYKSNQHEDKMLKEGEAMKNPDLADTFELLASEGIDSFTKGEIGKKLIEGSKSGGYLSKEDIEGYEVVKRKPLAINYRGHDFITNPPPSAGGILIAYTLKTLEQFNFDNIDYNSAKHIAILARTMENTNRVRSTEIDENLYKENIFDDVFTEKSFKESVENISKKVNKLGGTTHMSAVDSEGNIASMTVTNGEGSGYLIPGTGIMVNNMLGEEDLNPHGFHKWKENQRISSMMSPSMLLGDDKNVVIGSAGSNRIRSAIVQTVVNIVDFKKDIEEAVNNPRMHFENGKLDIELDGVVSADVDMLEKNFNALNVWDDKSLFFGGANCVVYDKEKNEFSGAGDVRRGGKFELLD